MIGNKKMKLGRKRIATIVGVAAAVPLLVLAGIVFAIPTTVHLYDFQLQSPGSIDYKARTADMILVGTVSNIEVRPETFLLYGNVSRGEAAVEEIQNLYQYVTVDVERYLLDKTGKQQEQITFKDYANGCLDVLQKECFYGENTTQYEKGERILIFTSDVEGQLWHNGYANTFKETADGKFQTGWMKEDGQSAMSDEEARLAVVEALEKGPIR